MIEGRWRTACGANAGCVEVAATPGHVGIRDSKLTGSPIIVVGRAEWDAFITRVKENRS